MTTFQQFIDDLTRLAERSEKLDEINNRAKRICLLYFSPEIETGQPYVGFCFEKLEELAIEKLKKGVTNDPL